MYRTGDDGMLKTGVALPKPRFIHYSPGGITIVGQGLVIDQLTGLMWEKYPDDDIRIGGPKELSWNDAVDRCNASTKGGYPDWRLPNMRELHSLINLQYKDPALSNAAGTGQASGDDPFYNMQNSYYWSATTYAPGSTFAWYVAFHDGYVFNDNKSNDNYVRCVR